MMTLLYYSDLIPILISGMVFFGCSMAHKILIPDKYSSFLQFKEEADTKKTIESSAIRMLYIIAGTFILHLCLGYSEKQISIGIFVVLFLNVWPAILQNHLLKIRNSKEEWFALFGYISFVLFSVFISVMTIRIFIPLLHNDPNVMWLDNKAITIIGALLVIVFPISIESVLAKFGSVVITQKIDSFIEEVYIISHQLNVKCFAIV